MSRLSETYAAVADLAASGNKLYGVHGGSQLRVGTQGKVIADVPFDGEIHDPSMINPLSIWEDITGERHVSEVIPNHPLKINIVLHQDPAERHVDEWLQPLSEHKRRLAYELQDSLADSTQPLDRSNLYIVGDLSSSPIDRKVRAMEGTEDPRAAAKAIGEICLPRFKGVTFLISDFLDLPLENVEGADFGSVIAVKTNHELEIELPLIDKKHEMVVGKLGKISLGKLKPELQVRGLGKVLLWDPESVKKGNEELDRANGEIHKKLGGMSMHTAQVLANDTLNLSSADHRIANAVRAMKQARKR